MKGLTKTIVALALVMTLIATMGMSAMAANYSTKTTYQAENKISVVAKATGLAEGDVVTYVATTDASNVNENTIIYIDQAEASSYGTAQFTYTTDVTNINASMFFGGSTEVNKKPAKATDDYVINLTVNGTASGKVYAAKQAADAGDVIRKFDLSGVANLATLKITGVEFEGAAINNFCVAEKTLIVSTAAINANGTLNIVTEDAPAFVAPKISSTTAVSADNLVAVAKAPAGEKFGIVLYKDGAEVVIDGTVKTETNYVVLPALGKNVDGIYAVELQGFAEYLAAPFNVKAYAYNGSEYVLSELAAPIAE